MAEHAPGDFCWVDLSAHDYDGARAFYEAVFGWPLANPPGGGGPRYGMFSADDEVVAGMGEVPPEMRGHFPSVWNNYVRTEDVRATVARGTELGARVIFDAYETPSGTGTLAYLADPSGAIFGLWEPAAHTGAARMGEPGSACWQELGTREVEKATAFYEALFGWTIQPSTAPGVEAFLANGDKMIGHVLRLNEAWGDHPPRWMPYFAVEDADATCRSVQAAGGAVVVAATDITAGRFALVRDVQGAHSYVIRLA